MEGKSFLAQYGGRERGGGTRYIRGDTSIEECFYRESGVNSFAQRFLLSLKNKGTGCKETTRPKKLNWSGSNREATREGKGE